MVKLPDREEDDFSAWNWKRGLKGFYLQESEIAIKISYNKSYRTTHSIPTTTPIGNAEVTMACYN